MPLINKLSAKAYPILKQGKYPWDYQNNHDIFKIIDTRTNILYPIE